MRSLIAIPALLFCAPAFGGSPPVMVETQTVDVGRGISAADFGMIAGNVYANFPSDLAPGDRISGTVAAIPKGNKDTERAANGAILRSLTVEICGSNFPVETGVFVCPRVTEAPLRIVLKLEGKALDSLVLDVPKVTTPAGSQSFLLPAEGLALNRSRILGPFGGDLSGTSIKIGDSPAHLVAESPRSCIFDVPAGPVGLTRIELREGKNDALGGLFRTVGLRLTPPRRIIHTGDSTSFGAEVYGLTGLERPLSLVLKNLSTSVVSMEAGDDQTIRIMPSSVSAEGTFAISRRLTGIHRGAAVINVSIPWSQESFRKEQ